MTAIAIRRPMPASVTVLIVAVVVAGFTAASVAASVLWWLTPAMVCVIATLELVRRGRSRMRFAVLVAGAAVVGVNAVALLLSR